MKEATGELNMTVVTLIAVAAIAALFYFAIWPMVQRMLVQQTCNTYGDYTAQKSTTNSTSDAGGSNAKVYSWECCPDGVSAGGNGCIKAD